MTDGVLIETLNGVGTTPNRKHLVIRGVRDTGEEFVWGLSMKMAPGLIELASHELSKETDGAIKALPAMSTSVGLVGTQPDEIILTIKFSGMGCLSFHLSAEQISILRAQLTQLAPGNDGSSLH